MLLEVTVPNSVFDRVLERLRFDSFRTLAMGLHYTALPATTPHLPIIISDLTTYLTLVALKEHG